MELVMGFYTNAGVRVLFVVGMCAEQTYEVGKLNADLPGLGCVFKRWCGVTREEAAHILKVLKTGRGSLDVNSLEDDTAADF